MSRLTRYILWILIIVGYLSGDSSSVAGIKGGGKGDESGTQPNIFKVRREKLIKEIEPASIAVFYSSPLRYRNNDTEYRYRQGDNFYYLTGINEPNCIMVLIPGGYNITSQSDTVSSQTIKELLFYQSHSGRDAIFEGPGLTEDILKTRYGMENVFPISDFGRMIGSLIAKAEVLYVPTFPNDFTSDIAEYTRPLRNLLPSINQKVVVKDPTPILTEMRAIKSPEEIALIRKAVEITVVAQTQAIMSIEPGMYEYEVQALIEYIFTRMSAESFAFPSIVGSGENAHILHPMQNRRLMNDGEMVVIDAGAEYHGYAADVTRTVPVNGHFSDSQKEIYEIVLNAEEETIRSIKPGMPIQGFEKKAVEIITRGLVQLGILQGNVDSLIAAGAYHKYTVHGMGHPVGLSVHDVEPKSGRFEAGMVVTVEPGIYINQGIPGVDPKYYNISVRIEDTILVTKDGAENLSAGVSRNIQEIERLMKKRGMGNEPLD
ncbi:MAG: aminopeptidase P N-terminal domain-containing protein [Bacteroidota bacterium]